MKKYSACFIQSIQSVGKSINVLRSSCGVDSSLACNMYLTLENASSIGLRSALAYTSKFSRRIILAVFADSYLAVRKNEILEYREWYYTSSLPLLQATLRRQAA